MLCQGRGGGEADRLSHSCVDRMLVTMIMIMMSLAMGSMMVTTTWLVSLQPHSIVANKINNLLL